MKLLLAHKIALDTERQADYFSRAAGTARFAWNWTLAHWKEAYNAGDKPSSFSLHKQSNQIKYTEYPWLQDIHRDAHAQPFYNLQKAFTNFFKKRAGYPKFKKKVVQ